jgi:hypothetical protein
MDEHVQWVKRLEQTFGEAIAHCRLRLRESVTLADLAGASASLICQSRRPERRRNVAIGSSGSDGWRVVMHWLSHAPSRARHSRATASERQRANSAESAKGSWPVCR